jgi:hypothetical protein
MHLEGPWLSTTGKRRGKKKWTSAEQKQQAEQLDAEWNKLKDRYTTKNLPSKSMKKTYSPTPNPRLAELRQLPSLDTGHKGAVTVRQPMQYTGNKIVGIGTMHKSNAVPIFSDQEAKDISSMRR